MPETTFPVLDMRIEAGDRFLLYMDGIIESRNAQGDFFGDGKSSSKLYLAIRSLPQQSLSNNCFPRFVTGRRLHPSSETTSPSSPLTSSHEVVAAERGSQAILEVTVGRTEPSKSISRPHC